MPALFYFHVAKTAGTSMINEIRQHFAEADILNEGVNVTLPFLQAYGRERLRDVGFIHGHPGSGVAAYLEGVADAIMLLRNPMDQTISNYLSLSRIGTDLVHRTATRLGFRNFVHTYPEFLAFQTLSLATGLGLRVRTDHVYDCLPEVLRYLESTFLLGTFEQIGTFMSNLARMKQWPAPVSVRHLNQSGQEQQPARDRLKEVYAEAMIDTHLGAMIAVEQAVYAKARSIAANQRGRTAFRDLGETARRVWRSASGEVILGQNFGQRETIDGEPAWWTLEAGQSHIHFTTRLPATLHAEIRIWHAVDPTRIEVWTGEDKLNARIERTSDGFGSIAVPLERLADDNWATITLHIVDRYVSINKPPWYPRLLLHRFRLG